MKPHIFLFNGKDKVLLIKNHQLHIYSKLEWLTKSPVVPLLYGEGSRAFTRLQEEIIKTSHDHSLFCWSRIGNTPLLWGSILAPSPAEFEKSGDYVPKEHKEELTPYAMTNLGLSIRLPVIHTFTHSFVLLNAGLRNHRSGYRACIPVTYSSSASEPMLFRHSFPEGPTNLQPYEASLMRRHHFYIFAGPIAPSRWIDEVHLVKGPPVLIVMRPTETRLFRGSQPFAFQKPENSGLEVAYITSPSIDTYPPQMFEFARSVLHLPTIREKPTRVNACAMFLSYPGELEHGYYLFFGYKTFAGHRQVWGCKIISHADLQRQKQDSKGLEHLLEDFVGSEFSGSPWRYSSVSDSRLVLELGKHLPFVVQDQSLQIATLRGPEQKSIEMDSSRNIADDNPKVVPLELD